MSDNTENRPAPVKIGQPEKRAIHRLLEWRKADRTRTANRDSIQADRTEYKLRQRLRDAADQIATEGRQP